MEFFKSPLMKALLALFALVVFGLIVWFIGPLLAFGEMYPFAGAGVRITVIVAVMLLLIFWLLEWPLHPVWMAVSCWLLWLLSPLLAFDTYKPFDPIWARVLLVALVALVYLAWCSYLLLKRMQEDKEFAKKLFGGGKKGPPLAREEIKGIADIGKRAVAQLKQMHITMAGGTGSFVSIVKRLFEGKRYLYELPWYMMIGNPGAGKTTALLNSGLKFPMADQMNSLSTQLALAQNTGTLNCAWWFTNEAVLVDTAGRYTKPEDGRSADKYAKKKIAAAAEKAEQSAQAKVEAEKESADKKDDDAKTKKKATIKTKGEASDEPVQATSEQFNQAEWLGFLGVLRQHRGRAPINGALLAVDVGELLSNDASQRIAHAARLRARLLELREHLGIRFPVYVVLTKSDLLRGFAEYFSSLTTDARAQVWGFTLPWQESQTGQKKGKKKGFGKQNRLDAAQQALLGLGVEAQIEHEMNLLEQRLIDGVAARLQEEFELDRRQALYVLPHEVAALKPALAQLLDAVFADSRYDKTQLTHMLRGVYFTSAAQYEGRIVTADQRALVPRLISALSAWGQRTVGVLASPPMGQAVESEASDQLPASDADQTSNALATALSKSKEVYDNTSPSGTRSYFFADALTRVIFAEAHLVKPNLKWEARFKLLRLVGHALVLLIAFWLASAFILSHKNNRAYLKDVTEKTEVLSEHVQQLSTQLDVPLIIQSLGAAQALPTFTGLDLNNPSASFLYGLYSAEDIAKSADKTYANLQDRFILPVVLKRMEFVMRGATAAKNSKLAYDTLRVYLLLHDAAHYTETPGAADDVRAWVLKDWQDSAGTDAEEPVPELAAAELSASERAEVEKSATAASMGLVKIGPGSISSKKPTGAKKSLAAKDSKVDVMSGAAGLAQSFNNSAAMIGHIEAMFSGKRLVQSETARNESLVRQVRSYLEGRSSSERLYERTKSALLADAPQDFTLAKALGPQANTLFSRQSGESLERGVAGLFTYEGYHGLFAKRLPEMLAMAQADDAWVMGAQDGGSRANASAKKTSESKVGKAENAALMEDIRRQYLGEYGQKWTAFLEDIRLVRSDSGANLSFDLNVLRQLAAADSPLARIGRMAARETTLSRPLVVAGGDEKSLLDKAAGQLDQKTTKLNQSVMGVRPEQRIEKQLVDERFSALREVVTGQSEGAVSPGAKPALEIIGSLLNEYYTVLVVADAAISSNTLPPAGVEAATKLKIEAGKLPAPFREVVLGVSSSGAEKVAQSAAGILRVQARAQLDRITGLMALMVGEPCRRGIAGRYPFAASNQEVSIEDFNAMFAAGGAADEFFTKHLAHLVDTSTRPWRYRSPSSANLQTASDGGQTPMPATSGPTLMGELLRLLAESGPNPEIFAQAGQIREAFFRDAGAKRMAWKLELRVQSLDASVTELLLDIDGQIQRYSHGPVQPLAVLWPGPRSGGMAEITAQPRIRIDTSSILMRGPWALWRLMERGKIVNTASTNRVAVEFGLDGRRLILDVVSNSGVNPLGGSLLKNFSCSSRPS